MAKNGTPKSSRLAKRADLGVQLNDRLLDMELELRTLAGVIATLRIFSETDEPVEAIAISILARCGGEAVETLSSHWRSIREIAREDQVHGG